MDPQPIKKEPLTLAETLQNPSKLLFQREIEIPIELPPPTNTNTDQPPQNSAHPSPPSKDETEESPSKRQKKDALCGFCGEQQAKYRCPGCSIQTCSLECSKGHKLKTGCKGQRDKTAMVRMGEFDENNLISDYNFLEETLRQNEAARRVRGTFEGGPYSRTPPKLMALINQARNRRIELIILSADMSRRKANTSYYDKKRKSFFWRIEWSFPSADMQLATNKLDEHQPPISALNRLLEVKPGNAVLRHKLRDYCEAGTDKLTYLLRKDCCRVGEQLYYKLDPSKPLRKLLERKTLIEFPVITVALPSEAANYNLVVEEPEESSDSAWGISSGKNGQSGGSMAVLVDPRLHLYNEGDGGDNKREGLLKIEVAEPVGRGEETGPPEEMPIVRGLETATNGRKDGEKRVDGGEAEEAPDMELAELLAQAAMADFTRKRKKAELEPGEIGEG